MENLGVTCDVCACRYNLDNCKCQLPQIKVTENCGCSGQNVAEPHFCQSFEKKSSTTL